MEKKLKGTPKIQVTTDKESLDSIILCFKNLIMVKEQEIVRIRGVILNMENKIQEIKATGKYIAIIESNIK